MTRAEKAFFVVVFILGASVLLAHLSILLETPTMVLRASLLRLGTAIIAGAIAVALCVVLVLRCLKAASKTPAVLIVLAIAVAPTVVILVDRPRLMEEQLAFAVCVGLLFFSLCTGLLLRRLALCAAGVLTVFVIFMALLAEEGDAWGLFMSAVGLLTIILLWARWQRRRRRGEVLLALGRAAATLTRRGLPLAQGLAKVAEEAPRKHRVVLKRIAATLSEGRTLSEALEKEHPFFPPIYVSLVRAGERSGTLGRVLARMEDIERFHHTTYADLRTKLLYPTLVGAFMLLIFLFWTVKIQPQFSAMARDFREGMPSLNTPAYAPANAAIVLLACVALAPLAVILLCNLADWTFRGLRLGERIRLRLPILGRGERQLAYAHFASTLAGVLESGASTRDAVGIACDLEAVDPVKAGLLRMRQAHLEGRGLAESAKLLWKVPAILTHTFRGASISGDLVAGLDRASEILTARARRQIEWVSEAALPLAIPLVGLLVFAQGSYVIRFLTSIMDAITY